MADNKKLRKIYFKSIDDLPQILSRLANYTLEKKITVAEMNALLSCVRVYLQVLEQSETKEDIEYIKSEIDRLKEEGLL